MEVFIAVVGKLDYKIVGFAILFLLCWMGYSPLACRGTVVWSDDFNDGNYDGWTICENVALGEIWPYAGLNGSQWTVTNNYLQLDQEEKGVISYPSTIAYGTWSFDFKLNETLIHYGSEAEIAIISSDHYHTALTEGDWFSLERTHIWIRFDVSTTEEPHDFILSLNKRYGGDHTVIDWEIVPVSGWHHIDVTRNTTGWFSVYHNGSPIPIMEGQDTDIVTSELFAVWFEDWQMIDNIVVDDEVLPPTESVDWVLIGIIGASAVVIIAVLVIILKRR